MKKRVLCGFVAGAAFAFLVGCGGSSGSGTAGTTGTGSGSPTGTGGSGSGGSGTGGSGSSGGAGSVVPASHHVVMVLEENQSYETIVGNTSVWPNYNKLIAAGALPTNAYADIHGSISDYFMLTAGQILTNDDGSTQVFDVDNLARRMLAAGVSFRVYAEGITQGYLGGDLGLYVIRHNPFAMLSDVADNTTVANEVLWPFTQFAADAANNALPEYSFIVPNIDDDAHTGTPQQADSWLQANVVNVLAKNAAFQSGGDGVLVVDFDEGDLSDTAHVGGHIAPVLWGPIVKAGYQQGSATVYLHESMLRTTMELLGLSNPMGAAATAPDMAEFFVQK
ncbi:MAG: alkaline phosphatase family protein [Acidobacteriaceae bacterium]